MSNKRNIDRAKAKADFKKEIFNMLLVWKSKQDALDILKDSDEKINEWVDGKGSPIVTAAVGAILLIIKETGQLPDSSEVRNV